MATDKKITELPAATLPILGSGAKVELVQGGVNVQTDPDNIGGGTVPDADATTKGIAKLYVDVAAQNTDGAPDQNAVFDALALKAPLASPALTGTMTINGESITPGLEPDDVTGTAIAFAVPQTYGSVASPETGNITLNSAGLIKGIVQLLLHNSAVAPTFGAEFAKIGGNYQSSQLNSIYFHAVSATRIEYTINQTS